MSHIIDLRLNKTHLRVFNSIENFFMSSIFTVQWNSKNAVIWEFK